MIDIHKAVSVCLRGKIHKFELVDTEKSQKKHFVVCVQAAEYLDDFISGLQNLRRRSLRLNPRHKYTLEWNHMDSMTLIIIIIKSC